MTGKAFTQTISIFVTVNRVYIISTGYMYSAMVPEYWLTEGGQSATGALLDHIVENHVASAHLANRAASQSKLFSTTITEGEVTLGRMVFIFLATHHL